MIELITGAPGAGKSTYAVGKRLVEEVARTWRDESGVERKRRLVCAGFRGLLLEHERLPHKLTGESTDPRLVEQFNAIQPDTTDTPVYNRLPGEPPLDVPPMVENWWCWCQPGDLIPIDEAQFVMPRGTLGRKPPLWIQKLEVHRHYGVDFLLVTQHPQLIDTVVRALVGLHRHVRSVMGSPLCLVYSWDHAANPERLSLANKESFVRRKRHYALFHSAVAHIKPKATGRALVGAALALLVASAIGMPMFLKRLEGRETSKTGGQPLAAASAVPGADRGSSAVTVGGCWSVGDDCKCITTAGAPFPAPPELCMASSQGFDHLVRWRPRDPPTQAAGSYGAAAASGSSPRAGAAGVPLAQIDQPAGVAR